MEDVHARAKGAGTDSLTLKTPLLRRHPCRRRRRYPAGATSPTRPEFLKGYIRTKLAILTPRFTLATVPFRQHHQVRYPYLGSHCLFFPTIKLKRRCKVDPIISLGEPLVIVVDRRNYFHGDDSHTYCDDSDSEQEVNNSACFDAACFDPGCMKG